MKQPRPWNQVSSQIAFSLGMAIAYRNMENRYLMRLHARMAAGYIKESSK